MSSTHPKFAIWLTKLESRAELLYRDHLKLTSGQIRNEIDTCNSYLEMLTEIADMNQVEVDQYLPTIRQISDNLRTVEVAIRNRKPRGWRRVLLGVIGAINLVSSLVGLGNLIPTQFLLTDRRNS